MPRRDPFLRRTATPAAVAPWAGELGRTLGGLLRSYRPGGPVDPRMRERVILAVTEVNGCRYCAWIHGSWSEFLGGVDPAEGEEVVLAFARDSAEAGRPLDPAPLRAVLPPAAVATVRATVAQIEVSNLVGNTADGLLARLTRRRPLEPLAAVREAATVALAMPVAVPLLAWAGAMKVATRLAPGPPIIELPEPGEANLLVDLLAQAAPTFLSGAAARTAVLGWPFTVTIALRTGLTAATVRFGRGRLAILNGVQGDAWLVVEGDIEPLLRAASGALVREIGTIRIRPS